ncbi:uncharacterized protein CC84DRAFT_1119428 [Paraphaeosphaeria sporulosa]|uniref:Uncharacterized protein n=1 Tax=Paraphaeosphaeria sporulosa TaxID=1460663 RepID=A0A177CG15_9PLEO|nr:uncharacterized protein CC84DRAFT_1119428 [Paraphaeosphaeria sporulosa]OAG05902.1 hypothetical protein CC84DRAFT_1119428 [Paraphaeosphaeria sporulosa]
MADELAPPRKSTELEDSGTKDLGKPAESSSDEHFSDASEGRVEKPDRSTATSPIPVTRVERVDDEPSYGEVPGTEAYNKRTQDAVPDEVEIVPEGQRSRSASRVSISDRPYTPGGTQIPKTVVEKIDPDTPSHGDVPGTLAHDLRAADAVPDIVLKAPEPPEKAPEEGTPTASISRSPMSSGSEDDDNADDRDASAADVTDGASENDDDGFGDDFDDFEEGGEGDDFGDFDDGFQQGEEDAETTFDKAPEQPSIPAPSMGPPVLDFEDLATLEEIAIATQPYIDEIYPSQKEIPSITTNQAALRSIFLSERSESLWSQLVAPPPLQPPDWVRSRIRRLFLVSLGVPVDLDEILPASKQKKLVLPSIHIPGEKSPRPSADSRNGALGRVKKENASSTSVDSSASKSGKRKGPPPPPQLDISSTTMLCSTTDAALGNFTDQELQAHVKRLEELKERANEVFDYWQKRMESALGDKDAFEQVIESLVAHAKKLR